MKYFKMSLFEIFTYIQNAPKNEITMYNKLIELVKNNNVSEDPHDEYTMLRETLISQNKIWLDIIHGKYGFFDMILT